MGRSASETGRRTGQSGQGSIRKKERGAGYRTRDLQRRIVPIVRGALVTHVLYPRSPAGRQGLGPSPRFPALPLLHAPAHPPGPRPKAGRGTGCRVHSQPARFLSVRLAIPPAQARLTCLQTWVLPNRVGEEANSNTLVRTVKGASGQVCCFMAPLRAPEFGLSSALPLWLYFVMQMSQAFNPPPPPLCCREGAEAWQALMLASSASSPLEPESPFCFEQQFAHQPSEG